MTTGHSAAIAAELDIDSTNRATGAVNDSPIRNRGLDQADPQTEVLPNDKLDPASQNLNGYLAFSDVSSELSHLPFTPGSTPKPNTRPSNSNNPLNTTIASHTPFRDDNTAPEQDTAAPQSTTPAAPELATSAVRKTSPGLAARLKALGFGSASNAKASSTPPTDRIGRLDEHQLRQLDEKHQAGSVSSIVSRRGRPWKGAGVFSLHRTAEPPPAPTASTSAEPLQLPEIKTTEPLAMDTQKYRLPDHTNGNGTKSTLDTRREHLERNTVALSPSEVTTPPPPPPKDDPVTPPANTSSGSDYVPGLGSYFTPGHNRPGSIYTLSRASFANQLAQLTSLQLPDAESLSSKVSALPTAQIATKALINAAEQIKSWISKASEVISGLDSDDDVEWAAAGGREGLVEVEDAITRFEELINVYVSAIEELQAREDIVNVLADDLQRAVQQMEAVIDEWAKIRNALHSVRGEVELAMEWEELWNNVLGDIQSEMDELSRLVFEMEERRHKGAADGPGTDNIDIGDLDAIGEDSPSQGSRLQAPPRFTVPAIPMTPSSPGATTLSPDDSSLLALFARMQPLRASLDFLPMRLSGFDNRAKVLFPTACEELEMRRAGLDGSYKKLEKDAEILRKELGEDRWVVVFRGAGRQAQKMHETVERSLVKLREALDADMHLNNQSGMAKKIESYEAKKTHYGPAIERVLSIIDKGVKDRLTVNGEVLRLHSDLQHRWSSLKEQMHEMDVIVDDIHADRKAPHLRDSISSMLSNDRSTLESGQETPTSSPPSSVIMATLGLDPHTPASKLAKTRSTSGNRSGGQAGNRRHPSIPTPTTHLAKRMGGTRLSTIPSSSATTPIPTVSSTLKGRPAWNSSVNPNHADTGHNFKPLSMTTPSPYAKRTTPVTQRSGSSLTPSSASKIASLRAPAGRAASEPPENTPSRRSDSRLSRIRDRLAGSPGPYSQQNLKPRLAASASTSSNRRASFQPPASAIEETSQTSRPSSSLASSTRRNSLLPPAKRMGKKPEPKDNKPRWRP